MDPQLDPPPPANQPPAAVPAPPAAANPTPTQPPTHNHPPYAEMITAAISALNERNGSSKRAIAKYIETNYSSLPPTHSALLTHHLKRLKNNSQLVMVKNSYKLPRSTAAPVNGAVNSVSSDPASAGSKRRPGRPPKAKPESVQAAVPVFVPPMSVNALPAVAPGTQPLQNAAVEAGPAYVAVGPPNGPSAVGPVRGRGRPPKQGGVKRGPGRPSKSGAAPQPGAGVGRGRGRPKRSVTPAAPAAPAARAKGPGRPRGRPPKPINVASGTATVGGGLAAAPVPVAVAGKRRGRPPRAGGLAKKPRTQSTAAQPKTPRKLSGKPLGRPKKSASTTVSQSPDTQLLVAYLDLKGKLENLQSRIKQAAVVIKPCLNNEGAVNALQELELLANVNIAPLNVHLQQPQPQPQEPQVQQPQPQQTQPLQPQPQS